MANLLWYCAMYINRTNTTNRIYACTAARQKQYYWANVPRQTGRRHFNQGCLSKRNLCLHKTFKYRLKSRKYYSYMLKFQRTCILSWTFYFFLKSGFKYTKGTSNIQTSYTTNYSASNFLRNPADSLQMNAYAFDHFHRKIELIVQLLFYLKYR